MKLFGNLVHVSFAALLCAFSLSFVATFGVVFVGIAMAVLWMCCVYQAVDRLETRRACAVRDRRSV